MSAPVVYVVTVQSAPGVDGDRALRALLKLALRRFGLRCIALSRGTG